MIGLLKLGFDQGITADDLADTLGRHSDDVAADDVEQLANVLEQYLRTVPDALATALSMSKDPHCGRAVAFASGTILTYIFDEEDLLPEASYGTLGLLDDAYLVHGFVATLQRMYPFAESSVAYDAPDERASEVVASLLPEGVALSLLQTSESTVQVAQALFPSGQRAGAPDVAFQPEIRVAEAVAANGAPART
jgi:hypothetical protein